MNRLYVVSLLLICMSIIATGCVRQTSTDNDSQSSTQYAVTTNNNNNNNTSSTGDLTSGLLVYYPFDGDADDKSGNGFDAYTVDQEGGSIDYVEGVVGKAVNLATAKDRVVADFRDEGGITLGTKFTISFWVKIENFSKDMYPTGSNMYNTFVSGANSQSKNELIIGLKQSDSGLGDEGDFAVYAHDKAVFFNATALNFKSLGWVHVIVERDADEFGGSIGISGFPSSLVFGRSWDHVDLLGSDASTQQLTIECLILGNEQDDVCGSYDSSQSVFGKIDEFRMYNRILTDDEIDMLDPAN